MTFFVHHGSLASTRRALSMGVAARRLVLMCSVVVCQLLVANRCVGEVTMKVGHDADGIEFQFDGVSLPVVDDLGATAKLQMVSGEGDRNAGDLKVLTDGRLPADADAPSESYFFAQGTDGGRILMDFGRRVSLEEVSTFSWHNGSRAPQVFTLFAADGEKSPFEASPHRGMDPLGVGWRKVVTINSRTDAANRQATGGQYGVTIRADSDELSNIRYLMFDIHPTETDDPFGNTFFCEIDAIERSTTRPRPIVRDTSALIRFTSENDQYRFTIDPTDAPDLAGWAKDSLSPVVAKWYPTIVEMLPSDGFTPAKQIVLKFKNNMGQVPAYASGSQVSLNSQWFRKELKRESLGAVVHELAHVVQQYDRVSRSTTRSVRTPGWIVEGIADYVRWYRYEPQSQGAVIRKENTDTIQYDDSYRTTANFLNWVTENHDKGIVKALNALARDGAYDEMIWVTRTGKSVQELGALWKHALVQ